MKNEFVKIFLNEWNFYLKQGGVLTVDEGRGRSEGGDFDNPVCAGEVRVFAESNRQLIGLVYKRWENGGWIVIPTSEFTVPATEQEILIGRRVYQLWNAFTASDSFAEKSWLIDTLSSVDQNDICAALLHIAIGEPLREDLKSCLGERITAINDPRLEYERTFIVDAKLMDDMDSQLHENNEPTSDRRFWLCDAWERYDLSMPDYALAAATDELFPKVPVLMHKDAWDAMQNGQLASQFSGYRVGDGSRWVTFNIDDPLPPAFDGQDILSVTVYKRATREQVGAGKLKRMPDGGSCISVQFTADVADVSEIVIVVE